MLSHGGNATTWEFQTPPQFLIGRTCKIAGCLITYVPCCNSESVVRPKSKFSQILSIHSE